MRLRFKEVCREHFGQQMKTSLYFFGLLFVLCAVAAQASVWQPAGKFEQIPLWPHGAPGSPKPSSAEYTETDVNPNRWNGKPVTGVMNVSDPTITVYPPKKLNSGAAVVVFPGGGYVKLAIDLEGTEVCDWLTLKGVTCIVLKYRVPAAGPYWDEKLRRHVTPKVFTALQDAQRAIGLVRLNAAKWKINPKKIGVLGFSAGGHLVAATSTNYEKRTYPVADAADQESCRPDFAIALYPGHMSADQDDHEKDLTQINPALPITNKTPPTFIVQAEDDPVDPVEYSLLYYTALVKAKVPAELHLYAQGGHAFALRRTNLPITHWTDLADTWLATIGMIPKK